MPSPWPPTNEQAYRPFQGQQEDILQWLSEHFVLRSELQAELAKLSLSQRQPVREEPEHVQTQCLMQVDCMGEPPAVPEQRDSSMEEDEKCPGGKVLRNTQGARHSIAVGSQSAADLTEYTLRESVWDAALFIGLPEFGALGSIVSLFALVANVGLQVVFVLIIRKNLVKQGISEDKLKGLRAWRNQIGHDLKFVSSRNSFSLVDRVCHQDPTLEVATDQLRQLQLVEAYLPQDTDILNGVTMCLLAQTIWLMCCLRELTATLDYIRAVLRLPTKSGARQKSFAGVVDEALELREIHPVRKVANIAVALVRLGIGAGLMVVGLYYLTYTLSIADLILSAVALEVVMNVDELMFVVVVPTRVTAHLRRLAPLPMRPWREVSGVNLKTALGPVFVATCLVITWFSVLNPSVHTIKQARISLCDGNLSFGFEIDGLGITRIKDLPPYNKETIIEQRADDFASKAVQHVAQHESERPISTWMYGLPAILKQFSPVQEPMVQAEVQRMLVTVGDIRREASELTCSDARFWGDREAEWGVYRRYLSWALGTELNATSCEDLRPYCFFQLGQTHRAMVLPRAICPGTCGCNSLLHGSIMNSPEVGCPLSCSQYVNPDERATSPCEDTNFTDLADPRTQSLKRMLVQEIQPFQDAYDPAFDYWTNFQTHGCSLLHRIRMNGTGDWCSQVDRTLSTHFYDGDPLWGDRPKLMTFFCPRTCNCDRHNSSLAIPPDMVCPANCY